MSLVYLGGGLCITALTASEPFHGWYRLPPSFVRAGWIVGVVAISSLLHTVQRCTWEFRCVVLAGVLHLLWPLLVSKCASKAELILLTEGVLVTAAAVLLLRKGEWNAALLLALLVMWVVVVSRFNEGTVPPRSQ